MTTDAQAVIEAMIRSLEEHPHSKPVSHGPVVTLSSTVGARGSGVAQVLAARLGVTCYDRQIMTAVAARNDVSEHLLRRLTDQVDALDSWLYGAVFGKHVTRTDYLDTLTAVVRGIALTGGVICGRGAHLILRGTDAFRVQIVGSLEQCATRLSAAEGLSHAEAVREVQQRNARRAEFLHGVFHIDMHDPTLFDLIINSDRFASDDEVVDVILAAKQAFAADPSEGASGPPPVTATAR